MSPWPSDGLTGSCVGGGEGSGSPGCGIPASPRIWGGMEKKKEIPDYILMLLFPV